MEPHQNLDQISTEWSIVQDPSEVVFRYASAIQSYFAALLKNPHDAEEVAQEFLLRVLEVGFFRVRAERGRFRDYLKTSVRNAAINFLQRRRSPARTNTSLAQVPAPDDLSLDAEWLASWRRCLLARAWRALAEIEQRRPDCLLYTVLRLKARHTKEDSHRLAARTTKLRGGRIGPEAYRKQLSRARRAFAQLLVKEVALSLEGPTTDRMEEELREVDLMKYVRTFLPANWRTLRGQHGNVILTGAYNVQAKVRKDRSEASTTPPPARRSYPQDLCH